MHNVLYEARTNTKSKLYKEFVQGADIVSKAFGVKLTPTHAVGTELGQGVPIYEVNPRDLDTIKKYWETNDSSNAFELDSGYEFRTFRDNRDGSYLIVLVDGSQKYYAMVADSRAIDSLLSNVTWNDMDVQVMLGDFLKTIGTKLNKSDVILADTKETRIQLNRWSLIQLSEARPGKYGETEVKSIHVDDKFLKAELLVNFDGFDVKVLVDTKYRPNVSAKKISPFVDTIYKAVGVRGESDEPKQKGYSVYTLVSKATVDKIRKIRVGDYLTNNMFIVFNGKDDQLLWREHAQITFITPDAEGSISFMNSTPDGMNESLNESTYNWNRKFTTIPQHML